MVDEVCTDAYRQLLIRKFADNRTGLQGFMIFHGTTRSTTWSACTASSRLSRGEELLSQLQERQALGVERLYVLREGRDVEQLPEDVLPEQVERR